MKASILSGASRIVHGCNLYKTKELDLLCEVIALLIDRNIQIESNVS
ncbi:adenosine deaminase, partial [Francisella tularensis subsp. holarctica]|nr:adenosine deaminase [Francisella tularensis subsp. holarctica]